MHSNISATFDISNVNYLIYQNSSFEISKVYDIGLQSYNDKKILVCGKDSVPLHIPCLIEVTKSYQ